MGKDAYSNGEPGFSFTLLGGPERVEVLKRHIGSLRSAGARVVVCTRGLTGAVKKVLKDANMLHLFEEIHGNDDRVYARSQTPYDNSVNGTAPTEEEQQLC